MTFVLIIFILIIAFGLYLYQIRKTPHGVVELKSALALKFIKDYKGDDIMEVRSSFEKMARNYSQKLPVETVLNFTITSQKKEIPVRFYNNSNKEDLPLVVFIHGGGWCIGSLDSHDQQCRRLVLASGYPLLAIDYTLSPEAKFPIALHEVVDVISTITQGHTDLKVDHSRIAIIGDSAGGNMAISSALMLIEKNQASSIKCIVPVYPVTDCTNDKGGSYEQFADGLILTRHLMDLFSQHYIKNGQNLKDPYLSPMFSERLKELPPCFVLTAGLDPLRDEGEAFADKLKSLGNEIQLKRYDNTLHSFFGQQEFGKKGLVAIEDVAIFLKKNFK